MACVTRLLCWVFLVCVFVSVSGEDDSVRLRRLEKIVEELQTTYNADKISCSNRIASLQNTVDVLEVKLAETTRHSQSLEERLSKSEDECNQSAKHDNTDEYVKIPYRVNQNRTMDDVSDSQVNRPKKPMSKHHIKRGTPVIPHRNPVAFHSRLVDSKGPLNNDYTIKMPYVYTNYGNGYNAQSGIFTCPRTGLYLFLWNILSPPNKYVNIALHVNGAVRQTSYASESPFLENAPGFDVLYLNQGDQVWLQTINRQVNYIYGWESEFVGVMLYN